MRNETCHFRYLYVQKCLSPNPKRSILKPYFKVNSTRQKSHLQEKTCTKFYRKILIDLKKIRCKIIRKKACKKIMKYMKIHVPEYFRKIRLLENIYILRYSKQSYSTILYK